MHECSSCALDLWRGLTADPIVRVEACIRRLSFLKRVLRLSKECRIVEVSDAIPSGSSCASQSCASSGGETESTSDFESTGLGKQF